MLSAPNVLAPVLFLMLTYSSPGYAYIETEGPPEFQQQVKDYLNKGKKISPHTKRLIDTLANASRRVRIEPVTEDPSSWHPGGDPTRSHTRAARGKSKAIKKQRPVDAIIYVNENRINPSHKSYTRGTLIHELVHAHDLTAGLYHKDFVIREKRAVFFQNIWRMWHSKKLRSHYHKKFDTQEYQQALNTGLTGQFVDYYFQYNDLP